MSKNLSQSIFISRESGLVMLQHVYPSKGCNKGVTEFPLTYFVTRIQAYENMPTGGFYHRIPLPNPSGYALGIIVIVASCIHDKHLVRMF